jgi:predicted peptidase
LRQHHYWRSLATSFCVGFAICLSACGTTRTIYPATEIVRTTTEVSRVENENERKIAAASSDVFLQATFAATNGVTLAYRLYVPPSTSPIKTREKLPLVVMMHGSGQIGTDNQRQLGWLARSWTHPDIQPHFPAYVLVPQVPARSADYQVAADEGKQLSIPRPPLEAVMQLVETIIAQHAVDTDRIYILGFSMGASGVWNSLILRPDLFAAALPIAGVAPDRQFASVIANKPVMIVHGNADTENPILSDRAMFAALRSLPTSNVRFKEYEGLGHTVPAEMVFATDWREWLFAQRRKRD